MTQSSQQITVLLVDDHAVVREGYRRLLERNPSIRVEGEAVDAESAISQYSRINPTVVVMDISLPERSGLSAMVDILGINPQASVLIFSMHEDAMFARRALQLGASGYVTKASAPDVLVEAVQRIAGGEKYIDADTARKLAIDNGHVNTLDCLSGREKQIFRLLMQGVPLKTVAHQLQLTEKTVANHQTSIKQKLGVSSAFQMAQKAGGLLLDP